MLPESVELLLLLIGIYCTNTGESFVVLAVIDDDDKGSDDGCCCCCCDECILAGTLVPEPVMVEATVAGTLELTILALVIDC